MENIYKVKSLAKSMNVLSCFTSETPELGVTEISEKLDLQKATVYNILSTFEALGFVEQNPINSKYHLGLKVLQLSYVVTSHMDYKRIFNPYIQKISQLCGETCYVGIPYGSEVLYIDSAHPRASLQDRLITGEHAPMYCTGLGKAMLAFLPESEQEKILSNPMASFTKYTITQADQLRKELLSIKERGYAIDSSEHEFGISCVSVPIIGQNGFAAAAVSVSGPSPRFSDTVILSHAETLMNVVMPLQRKLL